MKYDKITGVVLSLKVYLFNPNVYLFNPNVYLFNPNVYLFNPNVYLFNPNVYLFNPNSDSLGRKYDSYGNNKRFLALESTVFLGKGLIFQPIRSKKALFSRF